MRPAQLLKIKFEEGNVKATELIKIIKCYKTLALLGKLRI